MGDLTVTDLSYAVTSAFYCGKLVLACSTYDGGLFPPMKAFLEHLQTKGFRSRRVGLMENGSWAPAAARLLRAVLEKMKALRLCVTEVSRGVSGGRPDGIPAPRLASSSRPMHQK